MARRSSFSTRSSQNVRKDREGGLSFMSESGARADQLQTSDSICPRSLDLMFVKPAWGTFFVRNMYNTHYGESQYRRSACLFLFT